jgi:hypothetical protein
MVSEPHVELKQIDAARDKIAGQCRIVWALRNFAQQPLRVNSVRFPHQLFRSDERVFHPPIDLNEGTEIVFEQIIQCDERPGLITENAFAIFYATWFGASWRIFVRLKVIIEADGDPRATTELITAQKAEFSGLE